nr:MAG: putative RNA dependent RNA polymerase [Xinjiang mito-like virus 39]
MKKINLQFFKGLKLYKSVYEAGSMISLSNEKHLKLVAKSIGWRILQIIFLTTKETNRIRMIHNFAVFIIKFNKNHGEIMTTKYLKACQLAIQKKIAGQPFSSLREIEPNLPLPRLSKSGLPYIIKTADRASICNGSLTVIRLWLTLFSIYRIFKTSFNPKINTITDPFTGSTEKLSDFNYFLENYSSKIIANFKISFTLTELGTKRLLPIWKSSPVSTVSWKGFLSAYMIIRSDKTLIDPIREYIRLTNSVFLETVFNNLEWAINHVSYVRTMILNNDAFSTCVKGIQFVGALSFKEEAAGKLRVFAMVDVITQSLLKPLHLKLFDLFKLLPNDGTHDQERAFIYAQTLSMKHQRSFGFDLSSATDRLPAISQAKLLNGIFGSGFGDVWLKVLVDRSYLVKPNEYKIQEGAIKYSVGQPMGALSSWAMLNFLHHMMVQYCFKMENPTFQGWYDQYVVLGDDIVLFEESIANRYLQLCKDLGVTINESKSIVSKLPVVEFAKRTSYKGFDVSAFSFKEFISNNSFFGRLSIASKLVNRNIGKDLKKTFLFAQLTKPFKKDSAMVHSMIGYLTQRVINRNGLSWVQLISLFNFFENPFSYFGKKIDSVNYYNLNKAFDAVIGGKSIEENENSESFLKNKRFALISQDNYKVALLLQCNRMYKKLFFYESWVDEMMKSFESILPMEIDKDGKKTIKSIDSLSDRDKMFINNMLTWFLPEYVEIKDLNLSSRYSIPSSMFARMSLLLNLKINKFEKWERFFNAMEHMEWKDLIETSFFQDLTFNQVFDLKLELEQVVSDLRFFEDPKDVRKNEIDNPLKVLEFIQETVKSPEVSQKMIQISQIKVNGVLLPKKVPDTQNTNFIKFGLDRFLNKGPIVTEERKTERPSVASTKIDKKRR